MEVFCGEGMLTAVIMEIGLVAGEGIDSRWTSYGRVWDLRDPKARLCVAWLVAYGLRPLALHAGTPCTDHSQAGQHVMRPGTEEMVSLVKDMLLHQEKQGYLASHEQPDGSLLYSREVWEQGFGPADDPWKPWKYYRTDGCQLGVVTPDRDAPGQPHRKTQKWMANFDLGPFVLRCQATPALIPASHEHQQIRGSRPRSDGRWVPLAKESGAYVAPQVALYARCLQRALAGVQRKKANEKSPLTARLPPAARTTNPAMALEASEATCGPEDRAAASQPAPGAVFPLQVGAPDHRPADPPVAPVEYVHRRGSLVQVSGVYAQDVAAPTQPVPSTPAGPPDLKVQEDPRVVAKREEQLLLAKAKAKEKNDMHI